MAGYADGFWTIIGWIIFKKVWTALNKHLLEGQYNAITNIVIYVIDFVLFVWKRPFRDNTVNFSQGLAALSNMAAITFAALPHILDRNNLPSFFLDGAVVMWVTTAGTGVMAAIAALDPIFAFFGVTVQLGELVAKICGCFKVNGVGGTVVRLAILYLFTHTHTHTHTHTLIKTCARVH